MPLIPKHQCYVEPFAGGLAVFLAKPRSQIEVLNDLNGDLVTFYRCVRFHSDTLLTELEFVLNSRQEFKDFADQPGLTASCAPPAGSSATAFVSAAASFPRSAPRPPAPARPADPAVRVWRASGS